MTGSAGGAGPWVLLAALALAVALGVLLRARDGRISTRAAADRDRREDDVSSDSTTPAAARRLPAAVREAIAPGGAPQAEPVTLVQLSTTFCAPCRHTRVLLADLAARTTGLRHVDLDITNRPEVATDLGVLRTPTTLALDRHGVELLRFSGVPRREALLDALRPHLPETSS
ncbi:TlpA family protein disulfide reductase [Goodfellowiella coeruleoviolacea]|uniref:Thioredoxin n=1 Tax=Goodfellowiella coeruleoviolacea TaxID=334858 RepID=A0AAE3KL35_9PSEU|nr:thioredoxin family protein [Goodfellowiella coeruleoviolacea]MCP2166103.1 Thioredoxin [Goodfellowiella coeruleoviolacea]